MNIPQLEIRTLPDRLVEIIRENIVSGAIPMDVAIRQDALARDLKVSKIPLREALARLEQDGLVVSQPNRGFFVRPMSWAEAEEVFALRLTIEPEAAAHASLNATEAEQAVARDALSQLDADAKAQKPTVGRLNRLFHLALVAPGNRPITQGIVARLHVMADRYVGKHLEPKQRHIRAEAEHHEILDAWLARKDAMVRGLVARHLERTLQDLRNELEIVERTPGSEAAEEETA